MITHLRAAERAPQPWRNGGGITFEVARREHPAHPREFAWRVSIARVAAAGPFSTFAGLRRLLMVIEGEGMSLRGLAAGEVALARYEACSFDGDASVEGLLPRGAVSDLNVIYDPACCRASLSLLVHTAHPRRSRSAEQLLINLAQAPVKWRSDEHAGALAYLDALWLDSPLDECASDGVERAAWIEIEKGSDPCSDPIAQT